MSAVKRLSVAVFRTLLLFFTGFVLAASVPRSDIIVIRPVSACPAAERGYGESLSKHIVRWLENAKIKADLADDTTLTTSLTGRKLAFLVMSCRPTTDQLKALTRFRANGGKICAFYSLSPALGSLMGVRVGAVRRPPTPGGFARIVFTRSAPTGAPAEMTQTSSLICSASAVQGRSQVAAVWADRHGSLTREAAVLVSDAGWWMTHVLLADGDEEAKADFLLSVVGAAIPGRWNAAAWQRSKVVKLSAARTYAKTQSGRPGEIHAVWDHSGQGLYPGDWKRTIAVLKANRITDLFVNVAGAGFAHYPSRVLPVSKVCTESGDQLAACLAAAAGTGLRVHAWLLCFTAARSTPARLAVFTQKGWRLKNPAGGELVYLDPSNPDVQSYLLRAIDEIARRYPVDGVHLDFVRWYEKPAAASATPSVYARYSAETKVRSMRGFYDWRTRKITSFVSAARGRLRAARPGAWLTTAVLGKYPSCIDSVGQDWEAWMDARLVDYIVPMNYTEDNAKYSSFVSRQGRTPSHARKVISGIGVTANESRLNATQVIDQINLARRAGLAGVAFFDLDYTLTTSILPILKLGIL